MTDSNILKKLILASGLPHDIAQKEIERIASASGKNSDNLTLDELRELLANYLQDVLLKAKDEFSL
ncbi:MAG: hypothetical protein A2Z20_05995 [Bdellovibrionales bacterium RBG_16_40_8]|nr:MAG: hypothetical protein A2Z20_05995 [Bdellovibrionales bacterium RBG_16_40_8]